MRWSLALIAVSGAVDAAPAKQVLTVDGLGPVRIGLTIADVEKAIGGELEGAAIESDDICVEKDSKAGPQGAAYMFEDKKLTRISVGEGSTVVTPRGIGVGATAHQVRRAYGPALKSDPHPYEASPGEFLTFWTVPDKRGVSFETDTKQTVAVIHVGTGAIEYAEGCA
jgi:hypothetical protein